MPDPPMPSAPEGCVYGPWFDAGLRCWFCINGKRELLNWNNHYQSWMISDYVDEIGEELLRLANQNVELAAEVKRLESVIEKGHEEWRMNAE